MEQFDSSNEQQQQQKKKECRNMNEFRLPRRMCSRKYNRRNKQNLFIVASASLARRLNGEHGVMLIILFLSVAVQQERDRHVDQSMVNHR